MKKKIDLLTEFLDHELEDYGLKYNYELEEEYEDYCYFEISVWEYEERKQSVRFKVTDKKLEVEIGESSWYEVETYSDSEKYFWIVLLDWPFRDF